MPSAPRRQYLVAFVFVYCSPVLGFWLATDFADLKRRENGPAQKAVGINRLAGSVGKNRSHLWLSERCAMGLELGGEFWNDRDRCLALTALWVGGDPIPDGARD